MFKLFLMSVLFVFSLHAETNSRNVEIPGIYHYSEKVYVGDDKDIDLTGKEIFSLTPRFNKDGTLFIPSNFDDAIREMYVASPKWFIKAIISGDGDFECSVNVNGVDYVYVFDSWFYINWRIFSDDSPVRKEVLDIVTQPGVEDMILRSLLVDAFCVYAKQKDIGMARKVLSDFNYVEDF